MAKRFRTILMFIPAMAMFAFAEEDRPAFFEHPADSRIWVSGQVNFIHKRHSSFPAKYSASIAFSPRGRKPPHAC
jgi:hypothetical protein